MRFRRLPASALTGLATLALACSGADDAATSPDPTVAARLDAGPAALGLFELPGRGVGAPGLACRRQPYRQFDFWVGRWEVTVPGRPSTSANIVTSEVGGCAVFEEWHAANGTRGRSMNVYDASDGQWHQHWVENFGFFPLRLDGGLVGGAMVMIGSRPDPFGSGATFTDRYTWTPLGPDDVRQQGELSTDGGRTFPATPAFVGLYHRRADLTLPAPVAQPYCTSPQFSLFQEFDFTVGRWSVGLDADGPEGAANSPRHQGQSEISKDLDGCLYEEKLTGQAGYEARVFTNMRPLDEIWQRTYVDNRGLRIYLTGPRIQDGRIVLTGSMPAEKGTTQQVRETFEQTDATHFVERLERAQGAGWELILTATYTRQ